MSRPRVAIAHDYLTQRGGAERVVLAHAAGLPRGSGAHPALRPRRHLPGVPRRPRRHLSAQPARARCATTTGSRCRCSHPPPPGCASTPTSRSSPRAAGRTASTSAAAASSTATTPRAGSTRPTSTWATRRAVAPGAGRCALLGPALRRWDRRAARRRDRYLAISSVVRDRIRATYGIDADVLFPPDDRAAPAGRSSPSARTTRGSTCWCPGCCPTRTWTRRSTAFRDLPDDGCW